MQHCLNWVSDITCWPTAGGEWWPHLVVGHILIQGLIKVELVALCILGEVDLQLHLVHQHTVVVHVHLTNVIITPLNLLQQWSVKATAFFGK